MYTANQLEDAIVTAIESGGMKASVFGRKPSADEFLKEVVTSPKVFVVFNGSTTGVRSAMKKRHLFSFHLYIVARNLRSPSSAVRGDVVTGGIYNTLDTARNILQGSDAGLNIQPIRFVRESVFDKSDTQTVFRQEWELEIFE
ncbi:MAG: DUF1834 family protein [Nitrospinota bacterium]|nr:DUF1834 family protein [Nitrospinota bacterium]